MQFTEELEPCAVGADLCMGSLIKNAGGTIVPGGGYVAGKEKLIGAVAARLAAPGIGIDAGQVSGTTLRLMYQGEDQIDLDHQNLELENGLVLISPLSIALDCRAVPGPSDHWGIPQGRQAGR